jgi:Tfp pilus assembly protein PilP
MRSPMMRLLLLLAAALLVAVSSSAQAPASPAPKGEGPDVIKGILEQELEPAPGGFTYNAQGRRDPFVSLQKPVAADRGPKTRKPGMEGFLIQEVALKGIVKTAGGGAGVASRPGYIAIFLGTDGKSYFVNVGQRLFDGVITAVDASSVSFRQEVTDPLSPVKTRDLKKSLYGSEEARQ